MKRKFRQYHQYTRAELDHLWQNGVFAFDANVLLDMYRYSEETRKQLFEAIKNFKKKGQVWLPHQVCAEFYDNRINVIFELEKLYPDLEKTMDKACAEVRSLCRDKPFYSSPLKEVVEKSLKDAKASINKAKDRHPDWIKSDGVLDNLVDIFDGEVGDDYDDERKCKIIKEGEDRYLRQIPPGYKDAGKDGNKKYGDLFLWYQLIDKAKECKKPIVFVTDDVKEDWWLKKNGETIMPLPQLKKEMRDKAGVDFYIYTQERFLEWHSKIHTETKRTIEEIKRINDVKRRHLSEQLERQFKYIPDRMSPQKFISDNIMWFDKMATLLVEVLSWDLPGEYKSNLESFLRRAVSVKTNLQSGNIAGVMFDMFYHFSFEVLLFLRKMDLPPQIIERLKEHVYTIERWREEWMINMHGIS